MDSFWPTMALISVLLPAQHSKGQNITVQQNLQLGQLLCMPATQVTIPATMHECKLATKPLSILAIALTDFTPPHPITSLALHPNMATHLH
jgi:hypothetical protein